MGQVLHPNAIATHAIRKAIQEAPAKVSTNALAKHHGLNMNTFPVSVSSIWNHFIKSPVRSTELDRISLLGEINQIDQVAIFYDSFGCCDHPFVPSLKKL